MADTTTTTTAPAATAGNDNSIWTSLFGALPGVLTGTAQVINATKSGSSTNMYNGTYVPTATTTNPNTIWYVLGGAAVLLFLFFMFKNK